jgi:hypothetical protein
MLNTPKYSGEPTPQALASGLATLGRYGDEFMVHAAEGETVIPPEIFDANPKLKADLFRQMAMMGIKDPNRYVVGNSLNSINPLTGQPEFFFKKIFKSVKKVFKKALPIIAPIVGNLIAPGIGGIIASGLVTKMQGGSWGDVLKGAAVSWAGQGLMSGIGGALSAAPGQGFSGFTSGLTQGLTSPFTAASNLFSSGPANPLSQGIGSQILGFEKAGKALPGLLGRTATPQYNPNAGAAGPGFTPTSAIAIPDGTTASGDFGTASVSPTSVSPTSVGTVDLGGGDLGADDFGGGVNFDKYTTPVNLSQNQFTPPADPAFVSRAAQQGLTIPQQGLDTTPGILDNRLMDGAVDTSINDQSAFKPEQGFVDKALYALDPRESTALAKYNAELPEKFNRYFSDEVAIARSTGTKLPNRDALLETYRAANPPPGLLSRSAPLIAATGAAGLGIAALSGAFTEEEEAYKANPNKSDKEIEAYEKWGQIPDKNSLEAQKQFGIWNMKPYVTRSQFEAQTGGRSARPDWRFLPESNVMGVAMGGEVVGPGTGTSDSIPARLSDGEFVMTADAVRNAGGGNRDLGAARMYDMMRRFEGGVA